MNQVAWYGTVLRIGVSAFAFALWSCNGSDSLQIKTLSNRADLISGSDAFIEIVLPQGTSASGLKVDVVGRTSAMRLPARRWEALGRRPDLETPLRILDKPVKTIFTAGQTVGGSHVCDK
jgi:hypothetical protein